MLIHDEHYAIVIVMNMLEYDQQTFINIRECVVYIYAVLYINLETETENCYILLKFYQKFYCYYYAEKKLGTA